MEWGYGLLFAKKYGLRLFQGKSMARYFLLVLGVLFSAQAFSQDHLGVRLNKTGLLQLMKLAAKYNQEGKDDGVSIPDKVYAFKIKAADLKKNPITSILGQVSNFPLNQDLSFYLDSKKLRLNALANSEDMQVMIENETEKGFDLYIKLSLKKLSIKGQEISLCEKIKNNSCVIKSDTLYANLRTPEISLGKGPQLEVEARFRININNNKGTVLFKSFATNLQSVNNAPKLDINLGPITVPPSYIVIEGRREELPIPNIREVILGRKDFLASKLIDFMGDFAAQDLTEMLNRYFAHKEFPTQVRVIEYSPQHYAEVKTETSSSAKPNFIELLQKDIMGLIHNARLELSFRNLETPHDQSIQLSLETSLNLNGNNISVNNTVRNNPRYSLPPLNLDTLGKQDHVALSVSDPLVNAFSKMINDTGLFQSILDHFNNEKAFKISQIGVHFKSKTDYPKLTEDRLYIVAQSSVDLKAIKNTGLWSSIKNTIGAWLERNNNNAVLYFPLQLELIPKIVTLNGKTDLIVRINSPFGESVDNDFDYPTNITNATTIVRSAVINRLKKSFAPVIDKEFSVDLSSMLNQRGLIFRPNNFYVLDSSYLVLGADIVDIDWKSFGKK